MKITLDIPQRVIDAYCTRYSYLPELPDPIDPNGAKMVPNPQSQIDFVKDRICATMTSVVWRTETDLAIKTVQDDVAKTIGTIKII